MCSHGGCTCLTFFHGAFHHVCVLARAARAGYQHPGQKEVTRATACNGFNFLGGREQARCDASLPRAVRYEFCRTKCSSWGQIDNPGDRLLILGTDAEARRLILHLCQHSQPVKRIKEHIFHSASTCHFCVVAFQG